MLWVPLLYKAWKRLLPHPHENNHALINVLNKQAIETLSFNKIKNDFNEFILVGNNSQAAFIGVCYINLQYVKTIQTLHSF